jgi:4-hydroxy-tetrahydrodipicolinate reductase
MQFCDLEVSHHNEVLEMQPIRMIMAGGTGKTGREVARGLAKEPGFRLVAAVGSASAGQDLGELLGLGPAYGPVPIAGGLGEAVERSGGADVLVDFSTAEAARRNIPAAIEQHIAPVIGTTGFQPGETHRFARLCAEAGLGGAFVANFSTGVMLMMRWAEEARRFFPHVQILEYHHAAKLDNPSGTALRTKERLERAEGDLAAPRVPVYGVRLPGLVAHQEVLFGGLGQVLTIRHDALSREAYVPGVAMTCRWVLERKQVAFDLEEIAYAR